MNSTPPANDPARDQAGYALYELDQLVTQLNGGPAGTELVNAWKNRFVITPKPRPLIPDAGP